MKISTSTIAVVNTLLRRLAKDRRGAAVVEFAIAVPLFSVAFIGVLQAGLLMFDQIELANAANAGSLAFSAGRQQICSTCTATPATNAISAIGNQLAFTPQQLLTVKVNLATGSPSASCYSYTGTQPSASQDNNCLTALNSAYNSTGGSFYSNAAVTSVTVAYPCFQLLPLSWFALTGVCMGNSYYPTPGYIAVTMSQQVQ